VRQILTRDKKALNCY